MSPAGSTPMTVTPMTMRIAGVGVGGTTLPPTSIPIAIFIDIVSVLRVPRRAANRSGERAPVPGLVSVTTGPVGAGSSAAIGAPGRAGTGGAATAAPPRAGSTTSTREKFVIPSCMTSVYRGWNGACCDGAGKGAAMQKFRRTLGASTLRHDKVVNLSGQDIGFIEELMIDVTTGRVAYAVLSFGGFLGIGTKLFALPWSVITVDEIGRAHV